MKEEVARKIAVDWALSKEKWDEAQKKAKDDADAMDVDGEESGGEGDWSDEEEDDATAAGEDDNAMLLDSNGDSELGSDAGSDSGSEGSEIRKPPPQPEEGSTLFIRNVPFEATDDDIKTLYVSLPFPPSSFLLC